MIGTSAMADFELKCIMHFNVCSRLSTQQSTIYFDVSRVVLERASDEVFRDVENGKRVE